MRQDDPRFSETTPAHWRSLNYFNAYRLTVAALLLLAVAVFGDALYFGTRSPRLFVYAGAADVAFCLACFALVRMRAPGFNAQIGMQVSGDVVFIVLMMSASGGIASGLGLLLLATLAAAGTISRGRMTLFHAALASIAVLLEQAFEMLKFDAGAAQYAQAGLLSSGYFATAWLAHSLAKYARASEQLAAQREIDLENMEQVNQLVIQDMQDGVLVVDEKGVIRGRNARAEQILGRAPQHRGFLLGEYAPALAAQLAQWRENPAAAFDPLRTLSSRRQIGTRFVQVGKDRYVGAVIFLEDISRIQAQAQQLKLASLGRLTANIAHEIRNPLSAINHAAELLGEEAEASATQKRLTQIIHDNVQRLDGMVQDVLRLNRRDRAHHEVFDLGPYLRKFVEQFCQNEKIATEIFFVTEEAAFSVHFDRSHLNQIMWNLCRNALRHCRRGSGSIRIRAARGDTENTVKLDVTDDGTGVAAELRHHLFEPFFTTAPSGTGLGLYLARELCDANGATLEYVESSGGAQFTIQCKGAPA